MARPSELRERTTEELSEMVENLRAEILTVRFEKHTEQLENTSGVGLKRRDLARVLTILRERELGVEHGSA